MSAVLDYTAGAWSAAADQEAAEEELFRLSSVAQLPQAPMPREVEEFLSGLLEIPEDDEPRCPDVDYTDEQLLNL